MKRLLTSAAMFLCSLLTFAQFGGSGSGTESDPYLILNPIQLNQLRNFLGKSGVYFKLMADINLTDYLEDENPSQGWQPVGTSSTPFKGVLDGNGKTVSGFWIDRSNTDYVGFFGNLTGGTVKNLTIKGNSVKGKDYVGFLAGIGGTVDNCIFDGSVMGSSYVGGCCGSYGTFNNVSSTVNVNGGDYTGGLVGRYGKFTRCHITCTFVNGVNYVGGISGSTDLNIEKSYVYTSVSGNDYIGGVCGQAKNGKESIIKDCGFLGDVTGHSYIGGLCGECSGAKSISECFAVGQVLANGNYVGGLFGYSTYCNYGYSGYRFSNLKSSYFSGSVAGNEQVGGLIGYKSGLNSYQSPGRVNSCYANATVKGVKTVGGLFGKIEHVVVESNIAILTSVKATENQVGRIYGERNGGSVGEMGTAKENKAFNKAIVINAGVAQEITDNEQNGSGVSATTLKYKSTYVAMGWDFTDVWEIQESECYPYFKTQTAPPVITSQLVSGATTVSGKCVDGGLVTIEIDGVTQQMTSTGHEFSFNVSPLQAGHEVRISVKAEGKEQSYYTTEVVAYKGKGTEADPYQIYTASDLTGVYRKGYFKLMNDIDLTDYINQFSPTEGWESIGREGSETIHFDGDGHKITGLWCNSTRDNTGLFSCFANGEIKNLTVEVANGKQVKGGANTGIIIGKMINGTIENCKVVGKVADGTPVGGIIGLLDGGNISRCQASITITTTGATSYVGGLVGETTCGTIDGCFTTGILNGTGTESYVGGLIGKNGATVTNSYSTTNVTSTYNAAGLIAYNYGLVEKCYAMGNLNSHNYAAGVIGYNDGENAIIKNCAAMSNKIDITFESQQVQQGGGYGQRIIGGIKNNAPAPEQNNYALKTMQVSLNDVPQRVYDDIMNGIGKTQVELMSSETYSSLGWDFSKTWGVDEGEIYPFLLWELDVNPVTNINLDKTSLLIAVGWNETINASVLPLGATNKRLAWTSSNTTVATVADGVVTAIGVGTATITATSTDGSNVSATCQVTVTANHDAAITELQSIVARAQSLYDNSTEGGNIGEYAAGARAELLAVINSVNGRISSTMSDEAITQCTNEINAAIELFQSKKVTAGDDTDISQIANTIYVERTEAAAGSQIHLSVKMKNAVAVQGFQFDLYLPAGVTVATDEDDFALAELSTARTTKNKTNYFESNPTNDGGLRVLCGSTKGYTFNGNDGEVAIITLNIAQDIEDGEHAIILKNIKLSDTNSTPYPTDYVKSTLVISSYTLGDVNADNSIDVADFIAIANHILGKTVAGFVAKAADVNEDGSIDVADFIAVANMILHQQAASRQVTAASRAPRKTPTDIEALGDVIYVEPIIVVPGSQQVLSVKMKNTAAVAGFEFSLKLPEGITVATDEDDMALAELSTARTTATRTNYFDTSLQSDGTLKVLCGTSRENPNTGMLYAFNGNDGEIARITVNVAADIEEWEYPVIVKDAILSDPNAKKTNLPAEVETTVIVTGEAPLLPGDANNDGYVTIADVTAIINKINNAVSGTFVETAADVNGDSVISIADVTGVINIINQ